MPSITVSDKPQTSTDVFSHDEMNLAEFPIVRLGSKDQREVIIYQKGDMRWEVRAASGLGLPDEFGDRVIATLIKLSSERNFEDRTVYFRGIELLSNLGLTGSGSNYQSLNTVLKQLAGMTIYSKQSFWDNKRKKRILIEDGFNVIDRYRLQKSILSQEDENIDRGYIVWGEQFWDSIKSGYVKKLNYSLYLRINGAIARRLYRLLDKWFYKLECAEVDVFDLASRIGMQKYKYPSKVLEKLQPAFDELVRHKFLESYKVIKKGQFTRIKIFKHATQKINKADNYLVWDEHNGVHRDPKTWDVVERVN